MDNDKPNDTSFQDDDFDQLPDDCIAAQPNSETACPSPGAGRAYPMENSCPAAWQFVEYERATYKIPLMNEPNYRIRDLDIVTGDEQKISLRTEHPALFLKPAQENDAIRLYLFCRRIDAGRSDRKIHILLYREGTQAAVYRGEKDLSEDSDLAFEMESIRHLLRPGKYYLLFGNLCAREYDPFPVHWCGHYCYPFEILEEGKSLAHPALQSASAGNALGRRPACGTTGSIRFRLVFDTPVVPDRQYAAICYNRSLNRMGKAAIHTGRKCNRLQIDFKPERIWTEDDYFLLLLHNGEPFSKLDFSIDRKQTTVIACEPLDKSSVYYSLAGNLEKETAWNERLQSLPGMGYARRRLLELYNRQKFNDLRKENKVKPIERYTHYLLSGPDYASKRIFAEYFFPFAGCKYGIPKYASAQSLAEMRNAPDPYEEATELFGNCERKIVYIDHLPALISSNGSIILKKITDTLQQTRTWSLILGGTTSEIDQLFEFAPELTAYFPEENRLRVENFTAAEIVHLIERELGESSFSLSEKAQRFLYKQIVKQWNEGNLLHWNEQSVIRFIEQRIYPRLEKRVLRSIGLTKRSPAELVRTVEAEDIDTSYLETGKDSFEESMQQLNTLVGLDSVKKNMHTAFTFACFNEKRKQQGLPASAPNCHHMIFTGNPGTGKTTVAKMVGKIYRSMGLLSKGDVIISERSRMVGRYIGETEKNMQALLERAKGNVLFIDEAYTLCDGSDDRKDFGQRALESLLTALAADNSDMIVILAGYEKEMEQMLTCNPGLPGRFPHKLHFEDYSAGELYRIGRNLFAKNDYTLSPQAEKALERAVTEAVSRKDRFFSNARWMEQLIVNGILPAMAQRVMAGKSGKSKLFYQQIEAGDIEQALKKARMLTPPASRRPVVGYRTY